MKSSKLILLTLATGFSLGVSAQGFARFTADGTKGAIRNLKNKPSKVEVIVGQEADLKNIDFKYKLLAGCTLDKELTADFTTPQQVLVSKNDGTSKDWIVEVKKLTPAALPIDIRFTKTESAIWTPETKGWVTFGTDESKPMVVRFGNSNVMFTTAFEGQPSEIAFDLNLVGKPGDKFDGTFTVETSTDGTNWVKLNGFKDKEITTDSHFVCKPANDARFVRWTYTDRLKQNINLNNISIK